MISSMFFELAAPDLNWAPMPVERISISAEVSLAIVKLILSQLEDPAASSSASASAFALEGLNAAGHEAIAEQ
jgi:hypothetical protein